MARRVLVVDDEAGIRRVLRGYLEADGLEVFEAATGESATLPLLDVFGAAGR
ncbi:hypothetical protein [Georgenia sp. SUBG003]|uniref:hypothetical protein n=1 Tax=Georgenia sp. SUBG003 TaxID=1497974 RepID=UPI003AB58C6C